MKRIYSLAAIFLLGTAIQLNASLCIAIVDGGLWSSASTWSCGHAPGNNDTMWIPAGFTVMVNFNSPTYSNMQVIVDGTLDFGNGNKLNMCPGSVYISPTGLMGGGTPGSKLNICGATLWNGPEYVGGPTSFGDVILPVELISFTGVLTEPNNVLLSWSTATETNNSHFTIERSTDGIAFTQIGRVAGNGTVSQVMNYTFTDDAPQAGTNYYRLVQTDYNGQSEYKGVIAVDANKTYRCDVTVFPNPCDGNCTVTFAGCADDNAAYLTVQVIDALGSIAGVQIAERNADGSFTAHIGGDLKPGLYTVLGVSADKVYTQRVIVQ